MTVTAQDGQVREATWLGRDPATGLAFVQVAPAGRTALQPARWAAAETAVGDPLTVASLTAAADGYRPRADLARVAFVGEAVIGLSPAPSGAVGGLVVTSDGAAIGLVSRRGAARAPSGDVLRPDVLAAAREPVLILQPRFAALLKAPPREATLTDLGPPERAWLGVRHRPVTVEVAEARGLDVDSGVLVEALYDGPGKAAGLQPGDVLLKLDGIPLDLDPGSRSTTWWPTSRSGPRSWSRSGGPRRRSA